MSGRAELRARRERLIAQAGAERAEIARAVSGFSPVLRAADRGAAWVGVLRRHAPKLGVGLSLASALVVAAKPRIAWGAVNAALAAWRLGQSVHRLVTKRG